MKPCKPITYIFLFIAFLSCQLNPIQDILYQANELMEENPDRSFMLLSSYPDITTLGEADFAAYQLMYTKAKDKCYMDISGDTTAILSSLVYYKEQGDASQKGWSNFYAGRVYAEAGKGFESGLCFLKATEYAGEIPDPILGVMANYHLGVLHDNQYAFDKSLEAYKTSYGIYRTTTEDKYTGILLRSIGSEYGINGNRDSAYVYLNKALNIAQERKDTMEIAAIYNDIGIYLKEDSLYLKAKHYLLLSLSLDKDSSWTVVRKISLAKIHANLNEPDSARLLLNDVQLAVESSDNIELRAIYYSSLAQTEASGNNFEAAFSNQKRYVIYVDSIYQLQRKASLAETEQIYNYIKYQDKNEELEIQQFRIMMIVGILFFMLMILLWASILVHKKKKQALSNAEETIETLRKMQKETQREEEFVLIKNNQYLSNKSDDKKKTIVKKALMMQLDIAKALAQLDERSDKDKTFLEKFNRLFDREQYITKVDWNELYLLINLLYDNFADKLQNNYSGILLEKEIQLCCLLKANMDTTEIACVMGQSVNTVRTRKTSIRKKLNAPDAADIVATLEEIAERKC